KDYWMEIKENYHVVAEVMTRSRASTENILGTEPRRPEIHPKWAGHFMYLTTVREEILAKKQSLAQDANDNRANPLGEDMADAATDSYDRDWALGMLSSEQRALFEIEAALDRLARGTY